MLSIGDLIDKLVIENIKIFSLRDKIHESSNDEEVVKLTERMMVCNENRGIIADYLDNKINNVVDGKEKNVILKKIKTYDIK
jgi:septum formation inhibitor-activating ATPase MinD